MQRSQADRYETWRRILIALCVMFSLVGVAVSLLGDTALFGAWNKAAAHHFFTQI